MNTGNRAALVSRRQIRHGSFSAPVEPGQIEPGPVIRVMKPGDSAAGRGVIRQHHRLGNAAVNGVDPSIFSNHYLPREIDGL
jgi:hypothetical protein